MKIRQKLGAALAALLILSNGSPAYIVGADRLPQEASPLSLDIAGQEPAGDRAGESFLSDEISSSIPSADISSQKPPSDSRKESPAAPGDDSSREPSDDDFAESSSPSGEPSRQESALDDFPEVSSPSSESSRQESALDDFPENSSPSGEPSRQESALDDFPESSSPSGESSRQESALDDSSESSLPSHESSSQEPFEDNQAENLIPSGDDSLRNPSDDSQEKTPLPSCGPSLQESAEAEKEKSASPSDASRLEPSSPAKDPDDFPVPDEAPMFTASIGVDPQGYCVQGTFTEFTSDLTLLRPLYSLDGETYMVCGMDWDLTWLGTDDENRLVRLQNQVFLRPTMEPLKSYLAGTIDCFFLKLSLTRENGIVCETQATVIDRGEPQPLPEEITPIAAFAPSMAVNQWRPFPPRRYGRYQLTVNEDATPEDIAAYLPDTLPVNIQLQKADNFFAECVVECPVTWKPLSLPRLTAGESVTVQDAAEEIIVPAGTVLNTPMGIFILNEPLGIYRDYLTDEVQLILNVISKDENPNGVLFAENSGLHTVLSPKPTGATAIQAYTLSQGDTEWTELPGPSLLESVNAQPSTPGSRQVLVVSQDQEPYLSYRKAEISGEDPVPFLVGLKIEGGVYDGRQVILPWPGTYQVPLQLPDMNGSGGNQGNAGSGSKGDSTQDGQRPYLPQDPPASPSNSKNSLEGSSPEQRPGKNGSMPHTPKTVTRRESTGAESSPSESPQSFQSQEREAKTAGNPGQEAGPYEESHPIPRRADTFPQSDTVSRGVPGASFRESSSFAPPAATEEAGIQSESAPRKSPLPESGPALSAFSASPAQAEESDSQKRTVPPLLPVTTATAIYIAISLRYAKGAKKITDVLRRLLSRKQSL